MASLAKNSYIRTRDCYVYAKAYINVYIEIPCIYARGHYIYTEDRYIYAKGSLYLRQAATSTHQDLMYPAVTSFCLPRVSRSVLLPQLLDRPPLLI